MMYINELLKEHAELRNLTPESEAFLEKLIEHFKEEEDLLEKFSEKLGGSDELSPIGMVKKEHKLLLEFLREKNLSGFKQLFEYHVKKEETQVFPLIGEDNQSE
jgi:hemerythrin-like domain-containing protein